MWSWCQLRNSPQWSWWLSFQPPGPELHLSACQPVLPQLPPGRPAFPVIKGSWRNVGFFIHSLLSHALFSLQRTYRMPKDIHVEPEKFAAELINRLEEVQKEREAEEKLEERLKRVRAVSALLTSPASLALLTLPHRELSAGVASSLLLCHGHHWHRAPGGSCSFHSAVPPSVQGSVSSSALSLCKISAMAQQCPLLPSLRGCGCSPSPSLVPWLS